MGYENIPEELKKMRQWVNAYNTNKIPMQATENRAASSVNPETWSDYDSAEKAVRDGIYDHIGFVFANNGIVGIDIDAGFDEDGFFSELSVDVLRHCKSYCEKSRSGRGIHVLVKGELPFKGRNNRSGVEIYKTGRYFIMTGNTMLYKDIVENQEAIDYVVKTYFPETCLQGGEGKNPVIYQPTYKSPENGKVYVRPIYPEIPRGCRNISLTSLAGSLHNTGYSPDNIYEELQVANKEACRPPLDEYELIAIVNSVTRYRR